MVIPYGCFGIDMLFPSVRNYCHALRNIPEDCRSRLQRGGSLHWHMSRSVQVSYFRHTHWAFPPGDGRCLGIKKTAFRRSVTVRDERIARWLRTYSVLLIDHALTRDPTNSRTTLVTFTLTFVVLVIVMLWNLPFFCWASVKLKSRKWCATLCVQWWHHNSHMKTCWLSCSDVVYVT